MAIYRRLGLVVVLALVLAGCADTETLKLENKMLRKQIEVRQSEIEYNEKQASIARGCDLWRSVCPDSMVVRGRIALADGYSGSGAWFWLAFIFKLCAIGAMPGAFVGFAAWSWFRFGKPEASRVEAAQLIVASARAEAESAQRATMLAQQDAQNIARQLAVARQNLAEVQHEAELVRADLDATKRAMDALSSFG